MKKLKVGLIGFGTVGEAFFDQLNQLDFAEIVSISVKNESKPRNKSIDHLIEPIFEKIVSNKNVDVIVEAIDDAEVALKYAKAALRHGKTYITANKKMLAENLDFLKNLSNTTNSLLLYEACVCGAVPIIRTIKEHFGSEDIEGIRGIVNGSCNFILTKMTNNKCSFEKALNEAQKLGYAETDPSMDIKGHDAVYKTMILTYEAFKSVLNFQEISNDGIEEIQLEDIEKNRSIGKKVKQIVEVQKKGNIITASVGPEWLDNADPLYNIDEEKNAVAIYGKNSGEIILQGAGAGGHPTASALVGDLTSLINGSVTMRQETVHS